MDPDEILTELRSFYRAIIEDCLSVNDSDVARMADLMSTLDRSPCDGGGLPDDWTCDGDRV